MKQNSNKYFNISLQYDKFVKSLTDYILLNLDFENLRLCRQEAKKLAEYLVKSEELTSYFNKYNFNDIYSVLDNFYLYEVLGGLLKNSQLFVDLEKKDKDISREIEKKESDKRIQYAKKILKEHGYSVTYSGLS